jgi:hypothetical protein
MPPIVPPTMAPTLSGCAAARRGCSADDVSFDGALEDPIGGDVYDEDDDDDRVDVDDDDVFAENVDVSESVGRGVYVVEVEVGEELASVELDPGKHRESSGP